MTSAVIDACCLIDVLASGHAEGILRASGHVWHLPIAVEGEVQFIRRRDPDDANGFLTAPADISGLISANALTLCQPDATSESDLFTRYASLFRSDGEAMCLALAETRGWQIATDDAKAIRLSRQAGLMVVSSPQLLKTWADTEDEKTVVAALKDIEFFARFRPNSSMLECQWWLDRTSS
ncbi:MAG: hypothetical protein ACREHD_31290 [Pirellulales bacterium]